MEVALASIQVRYQRRLVSVAIRPVPRRWRPGRQIGLKIGGQRRFFYIEKMPTREHPVLTVIPWWVTEA